MRNWPLKRAPLTAAAVAVAAGVCTLAVAPFLTSNPYLFLAFPAACLFALLATTDVKWMFAALLLTRSVLDPTLNRTKISVGGGSETGAGAFLNLIVLFLGAAVLLSHAERLKNARFLVRAWALFLAACAFGLVLSPVKFAALRLLLNICTYACFSLLPFALMRRASERRFWIKVLVASSILPLCFADAGIVTRHDLFLDLHGRLEATFTHPNILAAYSVLMIAVLFLTLAGGLFRQGPFLRAGLVLLLVNWLVVLVQTGTRSAWISVLVFFTLYGLLRDRRYLVLCLALPPLLLMLPPVQERVADLFSGTGSGGSHEKLNSMAWRLKLWASSVPELLRSPIVGQGLISFRVRSSEFFSRTGDAGTPAHNAFLELLFETGVIGLGAFAAIFWKAARRFMAGMRLAARSREAAIYLCYLAAYTAMFASDNMLYYLSFNWYFWFLLGLVLRAFTPDEPDRDRPVV